jgi:hypothetical protein
MGIEPSGCFYKNRFMDVPFLTHSNSTRFKKESSIARLFKDLEVFFPASSFKFVL